MSKKKIKINPKMKRNKSVSKRFSISSNGLIKYSGKGKRHCLSNKNRIRKRRISKTKYLTKSNIKLIKRQLFA